MALVADSIEPRLSLGGSRSALPASLVLHGLLLVAALWLFNRPQPHDTPDLESVSVSIITTEAASDLTPTTERSDASQSTLAAGAATPVTATPVETADVPTTEPVTVETVPVTTETAELTHAVEMATAPIENAVPAEPETAAPAASEITGSIPTPTIVSEQLTAPAAELSSPAVEPIAATSTPAAQATTPVETAAAQPVKLAEASLPPDVTKPVEQAIEPPIVKPEPKPETATKPKPPEKTAKPKPPAKPKPTTAGSGGKSDANSAASSAASGGSGKVAAGGSAAESRYPGLVQAALRRALRFPSNAGNARGQALVQFLVAANGSVSGITIVSSTGSAALDQAAMDTVRRAAPFPPIPADAGRSSWSFTLPLQFRR